MATINTSLIASTGGDYATPQLWEADTDNDLVTADVVEVGEMASETFTGRLEIAGATTDSTRYRHLTFEDSPYDHASGSGPKITYTSTSASTYGVQLAENYAFASGICSDTDVNGFDDCGAFKAGNTGSSIDGCTAVVLNSGSNAGWVFGSWGINATPASLRNCLVVSSSTSSTGYWHGVRLGGASTVSNITVHGAYGNGFDLYGAYTGTARNLVATDSNQIGSSWEDFESGITADYCVSSDASAPGANSATSQTAAACFEDSASNDFRPKDGGPLDSAGTDLSGTFTTDITGATRSLWSIGAYDAPAAAGATATITKNFTGTENIPAHFQFSAWDSTAPNSLHTYGFKWTVSGGSEHDGTYTGPNLGLVFETAGTFTVRLDIIDSTGLSIADTTTNVTAATPTYDSTIYLSAAGSDSNDGLTSGAPKLTFASAWTALLAAHGAGDNTRLLLRRGDTFTVGSVAVTPDSTGCIYVDAYGTGDNPILEGTSNGVFTHYTSTTRAIGLRVVNVDLLASTTASQDLIRLQPSGTSPAARGSDFVIAHSNWSEASVGVRANIFVYPFPASGAEAITTDADGYGNFVGNQNVALYDCSSNFHAEYAIYGYATNLTIQDCDFRKVSTDVNGSHVIRVQCIRDASIRSSTLSSFVDNRTILRIASVDYGGSGSFLVHSKRWTVEGNTFEVGTYLAMHVDYTGSPTPASVMPSGYGVIVNNKFVSHPTDPYPGTWSAISHYGDKIAIVGNRAVGPLVFSGTFLETSGTADGTRECLIANNSIESSVSNNRVIQAAFSTYPYSLTIKDNAVDAPSAVFLRGNGTDGSVNLVSNNNVCNVSAWAEDIDAGTSESLTLAQFQSTYSQDANSTAAEPAFADPANDDWSIGVDSPCYDAGENIGASWLTREGTERSGTWDIGAFELGGSSITITPEPATATGATAGPFVSTGGSGSGGTRGRRRRSTIAATAHRT